MKQLLLSFLLLSTLFAKAQTTAIPDPAFEQELINLNIDSDATVNGQVLTADIENIAELVLDGWGSAGAANIQDITGIEAFAALEELTIMFTEVTELNLSQNTNLKKLYAGSNMLTNVNLSANTLLEEVDISNDDVGPWNEVAELDLSNCPNIKAIYAIAISELTRINLKNGNNNPDMHIDISMWIGDGPPNPNIVSNTVCIEVDNEELAQANQFPYSEWDVFDTEAAYFFTESCSLNTSDFKAAKALSVYPNPAFDVLHIAAQGTVIEKAQLYDTAGRMVREYAGVTGSVSFSGVAPGTYIIKSLTADGTLTGKVVVE